MIRIQLEEAVLRGHFALAAVLIEHVAAMDGVGHRIERKMLMMEAAMLGKNEREVG
jgi:hypothetical protein